MRHAFTTSETRKLATQFTGDNCEVALITYDGVSVSHCINAFIVNVEGDKVFVVLSAGRVIFDDAEPELNGINTAAPFWSQIYGVVLLVIS